MNFILLKKIVHQDRFVIQRKNIQDGTIDFVSRFSEVEDYNHKLIVPHDFTKRISDACSFNKSEITDIISRIEFSPNEPIKRFYFSKKELIEYLE
jgi:hypothetical protein